jgi:hypothetical protein
MKFITVIGQIILLLFVGFLAREAWRIYSQEHQAERVAQDGVRLKVRVDEVTTEKKSWRDYLSNSKYVHFRYEGKDYTLRYSQDSVFLQPGILIPVYYSASADEFVQSIKPLQSKEIVRTSPLVNFTVVRLFTTMHAILAACWMLTLLFVIFALGFLARLTRIEVLWTVQNWIAGFCAVCLAIYFSYNAVANWRYASKLRQGVAQQVKVEDIYRTMDVNPRGDNSDVFIFYVYRARVLFNGELRLIAVGRKDFEQVHPGENLTVLYNAGMDDLMGANYSMLVVDCVFPFVVWGIVLFVIFRRRGRS